MPERSIRFGIQDGQGHRASTWKCWTPSGVGKHDVYLCNRHLGGVLKASFHQSGQWHISYSTKFFEEFMRPAGQSSAGRFIDQWPRPTEFAPGVTLAFRIVTPWSSVNIPLDSGKLPPTSWIPGPPEGKATEIDLLISEPNLGSGGWPGKNKMGTQLIGTLPLESGEVLWAVHHVINMPNLGKHRARPKFYRGRSIEDLKGKRYRLLLFGNEEEGSRVIYDCVVEVRKNDK